jgi:hypothetical protein
VERVRGTDHDLSIRLRPPVDFAAYVAGPRERAAVGRAARDVGLRDSAALQRPLQDEAPALLDDRLHVRLGGRRLAIPPDRHPDRLSRAERESLHRSDQGRLLHDQGHDGLPPWTMERSPGLDAFVPILADGSNGWATSPTARVLQPGAFGDEISEDETFATYDYQASRASAGSRSPSEAENGLARRGDGPLRQTGRGQDTVPLEARGQPRALLRRDPDDRVRSAGTAGFETYYRKGPWLFGGEFDWRERRSEAGRTWVLRGARGRDLDHHRRDPRLQRARRVLPARVPRPHRLPGGPGAWEAVFTCPTSTSTTATSRAASCGA